MSKKQVLVTSVTKKDLRVDYYKCGGPGGQKVNKTSAGVRFTHEPSGAVVQSCESRKRSENERICIRKLGEHPKFVLWAKKIASADAQDKDATEARLDKMLLPFNYKVEVFEEGKWVKPKIDLE